MTPESERLHASLRLARERSMYRDLFNQPAPRRTLDERVAWTIAVGMLFLLVYGVFAC